MDNILVPPQARAKAAEIAALYDNIINTLRAIPGTSADKIEELKDCKNIDLSLIYKYYQVNSIVQDILFYIHCLFYQILNNLEYIFYLKQNK